MSRFSLIGPGRVGMALAYALVQAGYELVGVVSRRVDDAAAAVRLLGAGRPFARAAPEVAAVDTILVTTPDDQIADAARGLAAAGRLDGCLVCHTSGSRSLDVLAPVAEGGALVGSLHPLQTFARRWPPEPVQGCRFAVEAGPGALERCLKVVRRVGGTPLRLAPGRKVEYHAAASIASNHMLGLLHMALALLERAGLAGEDGLEALMPLVQRTLANARGGLAGALTGPIERGDVGTVRAHLSALGRAAAERSGAGAAGEGDGSPAEDAAFWRLMPTVYRDLALATLALAREKHRGSPRHERAFEELRRLLSHGDAARETGGEETG